MARAITFRIWLDGNLIAEPTIEEATIKIGAGATSHIRLQHPSVSRVHCVIDVGAELEIMDLGSTTGTFVNSAPVTRAPIASGDQLRIGDYLLDVVAAEPTTLLGSPVRTRTAPLAEPVIPTDPSLRPPALLDLSDGDAGLPAPPAASVVLPRSAGEPERSTPPGGHPRSRPATVELQEADLIELGHDTDPSSRRRPP